jgi:Ca2+-binding RTX toxin-like protein
MNRSPLRIRPLVLAIFFVHAGTASADTTITTQGRTLVVFSEDVTVKNQMTIEERNGQIVISDEADPFGMNSSPPCVAQRFNSQNNATQVACPKSSYDAIQVSLGGAEDTLSVKINPPFFVSASGEVGADGITTFDTDDVVTGDQGNDTLNSGGGNDEIDGGDGNDNIVSGPGNDKILAGGGTDTIDTGDGDDNVRSNDGNTDKLTCGAGSDTVVADTIDEVATDCEAVERQFVAPPSGGSTANDKTRPRCAAGGSTSQRIGGRRRTIYVAATSTEEGIIAGSGFLEVGGINVAVRVQSKKVSVAGGGVELKFRLSTSTLKRVARDHRRGRTPVARMRIVATDLAGNTSRPINMKIRLRK